MPESSNIREAREQATHPVIAAYHASRFPVGELVIDATAGIGHDAVALAARGPVLAIEKDLERHEFLQELGVPCLNLDCNEYLFEHKPSYIWIDPARRGTTGRRTVSLKEYLPSPMDLVGVFAEAKLVGIKCSPMATDEELLGLGSRIEFVSLGRECREATVWIGDVEPGIFAVRLDGPQVSVMPRNETDDFVDAPEEFIFDADPAAVRAHALGNLGLPLLGDQPGYLTGSELDSPWVRGYRVLHHDRYDTKRLRAYLRKNDLRVFEAKQRGAGLEPTKVIRELEVGGSNPVSLIAWVVGKSIRVALTQLVGAEA